MYRYSAFSTKLQDWAFDVSYSDSLLSFYLDAYYQSFLMIVGNYQVGGETPIISPSSCMMIVGNYKVGRFRNFYGK